ncbi:hypothetical protein Hanom_Chr10g00946661 [Helianthus anomalus]
MIQKLKQCCSSAIIESLNGRLNLLNRVLHIRLKASYFLRMNKKGSISSHHHFDNQFTNLQHKSEIWDDYFPKFLFKFLKLTVESLQSICQFHNPKR